MINTSISYTPFINIEVTDSYYPAKILFGSAKIVTSRWVGITCYQIKLLYLYIPNITIIFCF